MCEKDIEELEDSIRVEKSTIKYLKENNKLIINSFLDNISEKDTLYLSELTNNTNLKKQFKKSLQEHLKWIRKHCNNDSIPLDKFQDTDTNNNKVYCDFYKYSKSYIKTNANTEIQKKLKGYFNHLKKIYCSNWDCSRFCVNIV